MVPEKDLPELPGVEHRFVGVRGARMHVADDVGFAYLPDCGHFPPQERPHLVAERLRAFFLSAAS